jgi:alkaline phosphatase
MEKNNINRLKSLRFIIRWMTGTPNYSFALDEQATKFAKKNDDLLGLYMAGMTKYALENKADAKDPNKVKLNTVRLILRYVKEEKNNVKLNSELKKAIEAEEKGELPAYLKI